MVETKYDSVKLLWIGKLEWWPKCLQLRFDKSMRDFGDLEIWPEIDFKISKKMYPFHLAWALHANLNDA